MWLSWSNSSRITRSIRRVLPPEGFETLRTGRVISSCPARCRPLHRAVNRSDINTMQPESAALAIDSVVLDLRHRESLLGPAPRTSRSRAVKSSKRQRFRSVLANSSHMHLPEVHPAAGPAAPLKPSPSVSAAAVDAPLAARPVNGATALGGRSAPHERPVRCGRTTSASREPPAR